ncbi:hypothetical protein AH716_004490 [Salmonella enterica subsp. enterica]|nr:hypothetical protein [Salmonella enterica subsp. enterica serovar Gbadago]
MFFLHLRTDYGMPCNKKPGNHFTRRKFFEKHFFKMEYRSILLLWLF